MFNKRSSKPISAPPPTAQPPEPPPPRLVKFDSKESRGFVLNIVEVAAPKDGVMRIRLADREGWQELPKQRFEVRFRLTDITYSAWHSAEFGKPDEYFPKLSCSLVCRPLGHTTPLVVFLPDPPDRPDGVQEPASIYTCQFTEVSILPGEVDPKVAPDARVHVALWDTDDEAHAYQDQLFQEWQKIEASGELQQTAWPRFQLNTASTRWRRHADRLPLSSFLHLPPAVFDGLRRDVVAMGRSIHVELDAMIEAYVLDRSENYAPEYGDGAFFAKLAVVPFGAVLSARLKELNVRWREGGTDFGTRMDPPPDEEPAEPLDGGLKS